MVDTKDFYIEAKRYFLRKKLYDVNCEDERTKIYWTNESIKVNIDFQVASLLEQIFKIEEIGFDVIPRIQKVESPDQSAGEKEKNA